MRAIQSLWTAPFSENGCGYNSVEDMLQCTELGARLVKKTGDELVFYTDKKGYRIIKPIRHLFDDIVICLDAINHIENFNWGFSKIYVYFPNPPKQILQFLQIFQIFQMRQKCR